MNVNFGTQQIRLTTLGSQSKSVSQVGQTARSINQKPLPAYTHLEPSTASEWGRQRTWFVQEICRHR
jgi:hypothetical protein